MRERADFLGALPTAIFVALQKVAKLLVVEPLLLLNGNDVFQRLFKVHQVQIQILLVCRKLGYLLGEDCDLSLIEILCTGVLCSAKKNLPRRLGESLCMQRALQPTLACKICSSNCSGHPVVAGKFTALSTSRYTSVKRIPWGTNRGNICARELSPLPCSLLWS